MYSPELAPMVRLAAPLILAELGWMAMGIVDTMFVGRINAESIGAVGVATMLFYGVAIVSSGLLLGLETLVSQAWGAQDRERCHTWFVQAVWLALFLMPVVMGLVWLLDPLLDLFGIDRSVLAVARPYLHALVWSTPPLLLYFVLRRYLQALHIARPVMLTLFAANLVNAFGNWVFVLGNLGAPRLGAEGSAWSTVFARVFMAGTLAIVIWRRDPQAYFAWRAPNARRLRTLLELGLPAAGQIAVEIGVFGLVTLLAGKLNPRTLAGHQIALTTVSTTYMMPLGISSAAAVRVGHALGRGDREGAARAGWTALLFGAGVMGAAALVLLTVPQVLARSFTPDAGVIAEAAVLLRVAAFFQLFDGLQTVATGALRGAGDTRTPMLCHAVGYWAFGLPLGGILCFWAGWGAVGLWTGLSAALILIGTVLALAWRRQAHRWKSQPVLESKKSRL